MSAAADSFRLTDPDGPYRIRLCGLALLMLVALPCLPAFAAEGAAAPDVEARYRNEREACNTGQTAEDRKTCLREAAAAHAAAKRGQLDEAEENYARNALARCQSHPPAERDACMRRARSEGETSGSVGSGGILREYREITLPQVKSQQGDADTTSGSSSSTPDDTQTRERQ